jgi:hypothetical protein
MKNKYLLIRIFGFAFLIFIIFAYFLFYFIPSVENINRYKRELRDMNFKIKNFLEIEKEFSFTNEHEQSVFNAVDEDLKSRIPEIKSKEELIGLFTEVFDYIKQRARADGINNLVLTSNSKELELNATSLYTDKASWKQLMNFANARLTEVRERPAAAKTVPTGAPLFPGISHQTVFVSFSGSIRNAMNFINHLPWSDRYLKPDNILVSAGDIAPYYMVFLNVYYMDQRSQDAKQ